MRNDMEKSDEYIERVRHLPPAPTVLTQLLGLLSDPNRNIDYIVELISYDPSLTAEVLKRCNSVFFRGVEPAADISGAVSRLGFHEVYCAVVTQVAARTLKLAQPAGELDPDKLWRHSVATAVAASALAERAEEIEAVAFTVGLLHDVGKLVLAASQTTAYANLLRQAGTSGSALAHAEIAVLGVTHADVGARLLARWGLPAKISVAVQYHHHLPSAAASFERLAAALHLANRLAHHMAGHTAPGTDPATTNPRVLGPLGLKEEEVPEIVARTEAGLRRVQGLLHVVV